jgi:hypothetical protein
MEHFSHPAQQCSTTLGRCLLEWYWNLEDHCSLVLVHKGHLSSRWRAEALRVRRELARIEYPLLAEDQRMPRLLDDLWQETWTLVPIFADVLNTIPQLRFLKEGFLLEALTQCEKNLLKAWIKIKDLGECSRAEGLFEIIDTDVVYSSRHARCCPPSPFTPFLFKYPPGGILQLMLLSMRIYIRIILYAPAREAGLRVETLEKVFESECEDKWGYDLCHTFAAIEEAYGDNINALLPSYYALVIAGFLCSKELRSWLWYKFAHFEKSGHHYVEPVKKNLSNLWGVPELLSQSFDMWKSSPLEKRRSVLNPDVIERTFRMASISLEDSDSETMTPNFGQ